MEKINLKVPYEPDTLLFFAENKGKRMIADMEPVPEPSITDENQESLFEGADDLCVCGHTRLFHELIEGSLVCNAIGCDCRNFGHALQEAEPTMEETEEKVASGYPEGSE